MRKLLFFPILLIAACTSEIPKPSKSIEGVWDFVKWENEDGAYQDNTIITATWEFTKEGNLIICNKAFRPVDYDGNWIADNTFEYIESNILVRIEITKLTKNELEFDEYWDGIYNRYRVLSR